MSKPTSTSQPAPKPRPERDLGWRTTRCPGCDWEVEVNRFGDRSMCACSAAV